MAPRPPGTSGGTPSLVFTETVWDSCTSVTCSELGSGSFSSCSGTTVLTSGAVRFSFLPLGPVLALAAPDLAEVLEASTQWPVSLKHTGSDLLPEDWPLAVSAELELELVDAPGAWVAVEGAGLDGVGVDAGVCEPAGACWPRAAGSAAIRATATAKATRASF